MNVSFLTIPDVHYPNKTSLPEKIKAHKPALVLAEDVLDSLRQGEGLAGAIGPNNEDRRQKNGDGCGDSQNGFFLLCIQTRIQLLIPLPEDKTENEKLLIKEVAGCSLYNRKLTHIWLNPLN